MPRTILMHLNVELDRADERAVEDVEAAVKGALEVGLDPDETNLHPSQITFVLTEEV